MLTLKLLFLLAGVIYLIYRRAVRSMPSRFSRDGFTTVIQGNTSPRSKA